MPKAPKTAKVEDADTLRNSIDGAKLLKERGVAVNELKKLDADLKKVKNTRQRPTAVADAMNRAESRRRLLVDIIKSIDSLLNKKLPDKKSTEVTGAGGKDIFGGLANALSEALDK